MKERPILFSGSMVRVILDGRKTQTRRAFRVQPPPNTQRVANVQLMPPRADGTASRLHWMPQFKGLPLCPYGKPGDRLWVRETWGAIQRYDSRPPRGIPVDSSIGFRATANIATWCQTGCDGAAGKWRPSIFMPRNISRITLEIVNVRVERLQEIPFYDIRAEGVCCPLHDFDSGMCVSECEQLRNAWAAGWDTINGKPRRVKYEDDDGKTRYRVEPPRTWESNPWVWVIEFKKL